MVIKLLAFRPKAAAVCAKFDVHVALWGVCPTCLTGFPANALRIGSLAAFSGDPPSATKYGINLCECRF